MAVRVRMVLATGRGTRGVRGVSLQGDDHVVGLDVIEDQEEQQVLAVSANGYGKRTPVSEWRLQNRGGKGIIAMVTSERNGPMVKLRLVRPGEQIMVVTNGGQVIRTHVDQIREAGRNTQGVIVIRVAQGEQVVDVEPVAEPEDDEELDTLPEPGEGEDLEEGPPEEEPSDEEPSDEDDASSDDPSDDEE